MADTWKRKRPVIRATLSPEAIEALDALAKERGTNRSRVIEELILEAEGKPIPETETGVDTSKAPKPVAPRTRSLSAFRRG